MATTCLKPPLKLLQSKAPQRMPNSSVNSLHAWHLNSAMTRAMVSSYQKEQFISLGPTYAQVIHENSFFSTMWQQSQLAWSMKCGLLLSTQITTPTTTRSIFTTTSSTNHGFCMSNLFLEQNVLLLQQNPTYQRRAHGSMTIWNGSFAN